MRAVFLDKDGTLLENVPYNVRPELMRLAPGAAEGLRLIVDAGFKLFIVSNQSGVARGLFGEEALPGVSQRVARLLAEVGVTASGFYWCPHHPEGTVPRYARACRCRKPEPGLMIRAAVEHGIELASSWMVGDILDDVGAGRRAGCRTVLVDSGNETEWLMALWRTPDYVAADLADAASFIVRGAGAYASDQRPEVACG